MMALSFPASINIQKIDEDWTTQVQEEKGFMSQHVIFHHVFIKPLSFDWSGPIEKYW
jgi:hypothetical protein